MAKVIESKIVITEELRGAREVTRQLREQNRLIAEGNKQQQRRAGAGGGGPGGGGPDVGVPGAGGGGAGPGGGRGGRWEGTPPPVQPNQSTQKRERDKDRGVGWGSVFRGASAVAGTGMGVAGAIGGAVGHAMTPAIGGALGAIGGALNQISVMGLPVGALAGMPAILAGTALQLQWAAAQPAMQHFGQLAPSYRILEANAGRNAGERARQTAIGTWSPEEAIRISRQLSRVGAYEAFGTMTKMRFGGYEQEFMQPYFETAMKTGAAGKGTPAEMDRLGRIIVAAFGNNKNLVSMEQSIQTMTGLMGQSSNYLADISDDQAQELAKITHWGEASGTSLLRGQRMQETFGKIQNWIAKPGEAGSEMFLWQALGAQGMSYLDFRKMREDPKAMMPVLGELAGLGDMGTLMLSKATGMSVTQAEKVLEAKRAGLGDKEVERRLSEADSSTLEYKATKSAADTYTRDKSITDAITLGISQGLMPAAMKIEEGLVKMTAQAFKEAGVNEAMNTLSKGIERLANAVEKGGFVGTAHEGAKELVADPRASAVAASNPAFMLLYQALTAFAVFGGKKPGEKQDQKR